MSFACVCSTALPMVTVVLANCKALFAFMVTRWHICGIVLLAGRLMHYYGFHHRLFRWRRSGMSATWCALLLMVLANLWYMPWELVFSLR